MSQEIGMVDEIWTPLSLGNYPVVEESPIGGWHSSTSISSMLPVVLAVMAIAVFLVIRPRIETTGPMVSPPVVSPADDSVTSADPLPEVATLVGNESDGVGIDDVEAGTVLSPVFTPEVDFWEGQIVEWASLYGVEPNVIATIMQIESCGDPGAMSNAGAQGLFQVMPLHFTAGEEMIDPETNARRGLSFFVEQMRFTGGDLYLSFAGYNGGYAASGGNYDAWPQEKQRYYYWAKGIYEEANSGVDVSPTLQQWLAAGGLGGCMRAAQRLGI